MQSGTDVPEHNKSVVKARVRVSRRDNPYPKIDTFNDYLMIRENEIQYRRNNGITPELLEVLLLVVNYFKMFNSAVNAYVLAKRLGGVGQVQVMSCKQQLDRLVIKGYAELLGRSKKGSNVYIPSEKALRELSELIK